MDSTRQQKIARQIQRDIAEILQKDLADTIRGTLVTVTTVRVSPDLAYAKLYISIFPFERSEAMLEAIKYMDENDPQRRVYVNACNRIMNSLIDNYTPRHSGATSV